MQDFLDQNYEIIAKNIFNFRKKLGISQEKFAEMIGVERETISRIETADKNNRPGLVLLMKISYKLDVPLVDIFRA